LIIVPAAGRGSPRGPGFQPRITWAKMARLRFQALGWPQRWSRSGRRPRTGGGPPANAGAQLARDLNAFDARRRRGL